MFISSIRRCVVFRLRDDRLNVTLWSVGVRAGSRQVVGGIEAGIQHLMNRLLRTRTRPLCVFMK